MKQPVIVCIDDEPDVLNTLKIELRKAIGDRCIFTQLPGISYHKIEALQRKEPT